MKLSQWNLVSMGSVIYRSVRGSDLFLRSRTSDQSVFSSSAEELSCRTSARNSFRNFGEHSMRSTEQP